MPDHRLIVGLDVPDTDAARALVDRLGDSVGFYKIGLGLAPGRRPRARPRPQGRAAGGSSSTSSSSTSARR